jgi:hypothetical protein
VELCTCTKFPLLSLGLQKLELFYTRLTIFFVLSSKGINLHRHIFGMHTMLCRYLWSLQNPPHSKELHHSLYIVWTKLFLKTYTNWKIHAILKWHRRTLKLTTIYKMTFIYLLVIMHINNQSTLYKVNDVVSGRLFSHLHI